jgi:DNA-binding response OmpR family regulator
VYLVSGVISSNYSYDLEKKELYHLGKVVKFTNRERKFIFFMMRNINRVIEYDKIVLNVWGSKNIQVSTLRSLVRRVRDKLEDEIIENVSSKGYIVRKI